MNETNQKEILGYIQKLPKEVKDFVFAGEWEKRTQEISTKYSLDNNRADILANKVLLILLGLEAPEDLLDVLMSELGVSKIMAEQIKADIEKRVFEYAIKEIEPKTTAKAQPQSNLGQIPSIIKDIPEVRPEITPMVEKVQTPKPEQKTDSYWAKSAPADKISVPRYIPEPVKPQPTPMAPQIPATPPAPKPFTASTPIPPKPPVPPTPTVPPPPLSTPPTINMTSQSGVSAERKPVVEVPKKYTIDPYREPLE